MRLLQSHSLSNMPSGLARVGDVIYTFWYFVGLSTSLYTQSMTPEHIQDMTFFELVLQLKHLELLLQWPKSIGFPNPPVAYDFRGHDPLNSSQSHKGAFSGDWIVIRQSFCSALFNSTYILSLAVIGYQEHRRHSTEKKCFKYNLLKFGESALKPCESV